MWPALVTPVSFTGTFRAGTTAFRLLYDRVTTAIRKHATARQWSVDECLYIEFLIGGFFEEYLAWGWPEPPNLGAYLNLVERRSSFRASALMAHAYLHMAYDLPRTVANARLAAPAMAIAPVIANERYLQLTPLFAEVLRRSASSFRLFGVMALPGLVLRGSLSLSSAISKWVAEIRSVALPRSDVFMGLPGIPSRPVIEARILSTMTEEVRVVLDRWWNPALWFRLPAVPPFLATLPLVASGSWLSSSATWIVLAALPVYLLAAYFGLVVLANQLGRAVHTAVVEALPRPETGLGPSVTPDIEPPPPTPTPTVIPD